MDEYVDEILTVDDVMELLYVGKNTVYSLLQSGQLKGFRLGRSWRIPRESLTKFIIEKAGL
jgi:excisionase family DNA binding protein